MDGNVLASLDREELSRYRWWWRKYVILKYAAALAYLTAFADQLWHHLRIPRDLLYPLLIVAGFVVMMWRGLLDCPRCGERFYTASSRRECRNCGLRLTEISTVAQTP